MKKYKFHIKKKCICSGDLNKPIEFSKLPVINNFQKVKTKKYPTLISQCEACKLVQLKYCIADKHIFPKNYAYLSGDSKEKLINYNDLISKIKKKFSIRKKMRVLDIGGNDGSLMEIAKKNGFNVLNIEPTSVAKISKLKKVQTIEKKFNLPFAKILQKKNKKFDFVFSTNFLAHTNHLKEILQGINLILKSDGVLVVEVQYLINVLKTNGFDSFHQDHKYYYTVSTLKKILNIFGIFVFDYEFTDRSKEILRVYAKKNENPISKRLIKIIKYEKNYNTYERILKLNKFRKKYLFRFNNLINKLSKKNIVAVSAAPRGCVLISSLNLSNNLIKYVGEVPGSFKIKNFMPSSNIKIVNENKILLDKPDYIIILAWHLKKRIISFFRKKKTKSKFIIPLPKLKIIK